MFLIFRLTIQSQLETSVNQYWSKGCGEIYKQFSLDKYQWLCSSVDECLDVDLINLSSIPSEGRFFHLNFF